MITVEELRKQGWQVKVQHVREFVGVEREEDDRFMTRGQYEQASMDGTLIVFAAKFYNEVYKVPYTQNPSYGQAVSPINGWTQVTVTTPSGITVTAKHSFNGKPFNRKLGVKAALGRIFNELRGETARRREKRLAKKEMV